jgi:hypothetical protein
MSLLRFPLASLLLATACITASPNRKPAVTALEHEALAVKAEQQALQEEKRTDPGLYVTQRCGPPPTTPLFAPAPGVPGQQVPTPQTMTPANDPCMSGAINVRRDHEQEAMSQRRIADEHRAAAAKLRSREARACDGLSYRERTANLFVPEEQLLAVTALPDHSRTGKASSQLGGATLLIRDQPGRGPAEVEQILQCQVARSAVSGKSELERSPLGVPGAKTNVIETDDGVLVEVTANDRKAAREIARRARELGMNKAQASQ